MKPTGSQLTNIEQRAIKLLARPMTCTELGEALWGQMWRNPQSYARPAGKIIRRLIAAGLVVRVYPAGWQERAAQYSKVRQ